MRSIWLRLRASNCAWPSVDEPMRTPSTSTTVLLVLAPRMKKPEFWPGPPLRASCRPASRRSRSSSESALVVRMRSLSMTTMSALLRPALGLAGADDHDRVESRRRLHASPSARGREERRAGASAGGFQGAAPQDGRTWMNVPTSGKRPLPRGRLRHEREPKPRPLAGRYPGWRGDLGDLPEGVRLQWHVRADWSRSESGSARRTVAGAARFRSAPATPSFLASRLTVKA